ncbi:hypothetical protein C8Q72DRAFT_864829 [Fomitopsis betulina]|nr:hypothetical protein C8Q72DRAFT_864829 [Fomitopsis betulina]
MRSLRVLVALSVVLSASLASLLMRQNLSYCAEDCMDGAESRQCDSDDYSCLCSDTKWVSDVTSCISESCSSRALSEFQDFCAQQPAQSEVSTSSTGSGAPSTAQSTGTRLSVKSQHFSISESASNTTGSITSVTETTTSGPPILSSGSQLPPGQTTIASLSTVPAPSSGNLTIPYTSQPTPTYTYPPTVV